MQEKNKNRLANFFLASNGEILKMVLNGHGQKREGLLLYMGPSLNVKTPFGLYLSNVL